MMKSLTIAAAAALLAMGAQAGEIVSSVDKETLAKSKTTSLGLHLTAEDAGKALAGNPDIVFIDVRDPIEVFFVGHPESADANVPLRIVGHAFNAKKGRYASRANENFVAEVDAVMAREGADKDDPVFTICRSGNRSAVAAEKLAKAGYTNVWNLVDGFEGDKNDAGRRQVNGWQNADLPWTYDLDAETAWSAPATN